MANNLSKISERITIILLAIMISSLLNICLFSFQAKASPIQLPKLNFAYNEDGNCLAVPMPEPTQRINRPALPMPQCCLAQNRNYNAVVNTANDNSAPTFTSLIILPVENSNFKNNTSHYTARSTYPPPEALALASTVIRE